MRIPTYVSKHTVSAQQIQTPQIPEPVKLDSIIQGVEQQYDQYRQQEEEEFKLFAEAEAQRTSFEIDKLYADMADRIDQGGSYANAQAEFQKKYESLVNGSLSKMGNDDRSRMVAERMKLNYERSGLEYGLKIKSAIRSRAKRDAAAAASQREELALREFVSSDDPTMAVQKFTQTVAGLEGAGVIARGEGKGKIARFVSKGILLKADMMAQTDPTAALDFVEKNKNSLDIEGYVSARGTLLKAVNAQGLSLSVDRAFAAYESGEPIIEPQKEDVEAVVEDSERQVQAQTMTQEILERRIVGAMVASGKAPDSVKARVETAFMTSPENITPESAKDIAMYARIVDTAVKSRATLVGGGKDNIDKETALVASTIARKTARGIDETTAVRETLMRFNDPNFKEVFEAAKKDLVTIKYGKEAPYDKLVKTAAEELDTDMLGVSMVRSEIIDDYASNRALGMSHADAEKAAIDNQRGRIGKFNGATVLLAPQNITTIRDEYKWRASAQKKLAEVYPKYSDYPAVLYGDDETQRMIAAGANTMEIPFRLGYKASNGIVVPLENPKVGGPLYVTADPQIFKNLKSEFETVQSAEDYVQSIDFGGLNEAIDRKKYAQFLIDRKVKKERADKFGTINAFVQSDYYQP